MCAALAAGSGGSGRYLMLCLSCFPLPAPRVPRCVWRAIPSGCFLPSLAGTPFHAVCAFRELGPVALLVVPACPLRVRALALPRRPLPPPLGGVACAPRVVAALGAGRAVQRGPCPSACPAPVPCSVWRARGGWSGPGSSLPGLVCTPCGGCVPRGWWGAVPGGGWPATVGRGVWCQALSLPRPPVLWGMQPGYRDPCVPGAVGAGVGTQHRFHSVRHCGPALLAVGLAEGRPRAGCLPPLGGASEPARSPSQDCPPTGRAVGVRHPHAVGTGVWVWGAITAPLACMPCGGCVPRGRRWAVPGGGGLPRLRGASGVRRCPFPCRPSSGAGGRGPLTRVSRLRSVRAWGPSTGPTACSLAGRRCSLWGWREGVPGGDAFHRCEGRLRSGAPPPPAARLLGGLLGPLPTCYGRGRVGLGAQHCPLGLHALWGLRAVGVLGGRPRGGVSCHRCEGRLVSGAVPPPTARPLGRAAGVPRPVCSGCGRCGRGDPAPVPQRAPLRAGVARFGVGGRASLGGCLPPL